MAVEDINILMELQSSFKHSMVKEVQVFSHDGLSLMNTLLSSGEWVLLGASSGVDENNEPCHSFAIGRVI